MLLRITQDSKELIKQIISKRDRKRFCGLSALWGIAMKKSKKNLNVFKHIIITAVAGVLFWIVGEELFPLLTEKMPAPFGIPIYFLIFFIFVAAALIALSFYKADFSDAKNKSNIKSSLKITAITLVVFLIASGVFEFLYELGKQEIPQPTSVIIMFDDSGSMSGTEQERASAVNTLMQNDAVDMPYAVYSFTDSAKCIKPMGVYNGSVSNDLKFESNGGTEVLNSINDVLNDFQQGRLSGAGSYPKIIVISDGASSTFNMNSVTSRCRNAGISVSTVGVSNCDKSFLEKIARNTGGVFVYCSDVSSLSQSIGSAMQADTSRNLLSERIVFKNNALYAFLRILFLTILAAGWSFMKVQFTYENSNKIAKIFFISLATCIAGGILVECLANSSLSIKFVRFIFCVLWAVTPGTTLALKKNNRGSTSVIDSAGAEISGDDNSDTLQKSINNKTDDNSAVGERRISLNDDDLFQKDTSQDNNNPFGNDPFFNNSDVPPNPFFSESDNDPFDDSYNPFSDDNTKW